MISELSKDITWFRSNIDFRLDYLCAFIREPVLLVKRNDVIGLSYDTTYHDPQKSVYRGVVWIHKEFSKYPIEIHKINFSIITNIHDSYIRDQKINKILSERANII